MKNVSKILFFLALIALGMTNVYGQQLSQTEKEALQRRVKDKVDEFQFYIGQLADKKSTSRTVKDNAFNLSLKLFIGECENYSVYDEDIGREVVKSAVRMETSSKYRSQKTRTLMKRYLNNLRNNQTFSQIEITDADAVHVSNIERVGDHYECIATFCQKYIGYRDRRIAYSDITTKKVRVYINAIEVPRADGKIQIIWNAFLGDIYVIETHSL